MAHISQELAFGLTGLFGAKLGCAQAPGLASLPDDDEQRRKDEQEADAHDPVLTTDDRTLKLGIGPRGLQLTTALGQLFLHVARDLMDAGAEALRRLHGAALFIVAQHVKGLGRPPGRPQHLRLHEALARIDDAVRRKLAQALQITPGALDVAHTRPRHAAQRQDVQRQEGLAVNKPSVRRQAFQHLGRQLPHIGHRSAQGRVIGANGRNTGPLSQAVVRRVIMLGPR
ncbi:hypothetical protein ACMZ4W_00072 [Brevundimonas naejangsanensis]